MLQLIGCPAGRSFSCHLPKQSVHGQVLASLSLTYMACGALYIFSYFCFCTNTEWVHTADCYALIDVHAYGCF